MLFAYAAGFATGTFVGIIIEEKLAIGTLVIRVIVDKNECELKERLQSRIWCYGVDAKGKNGLQFQRKYRRPVFDMKGNVVGITAYGISKQNVNAVIPADYVADWVKELSKHPLATSEL